MYSSCCRLGLGMLLIIGACVNVWLSKGGFTDRWIGGWVRGVRRAAMILRFRFNNESSSDGKETSKIQKNLKPKLFCLINLMQRFTNQEERISLLWITCLFQQKLIFELSCFTEHIIRNRKRQRKNKLEVLLERKVSRWCCDHAMVVVVVVVCCRLLVFVVLWWSSLIGDGG